MIGQNNVGRDQHIHMHSQVRIDTSLVLAMAESQGFVSPQRADELKNQIARAERDLDTLRRDHPIWREEIDAAISAFNTSDLDAARAAFMRIDELIGERRKELAREAARSKHTQATLFFSNDPSMAAPLLGEAARLAGEDAEYWTDFGLSLLGAGDTTAAVDALMKAQQISRVQDNFPILAEALLGLGNALYAQGDLAEAKSAYSEGVEVARKADGELLWSHQIQDYGIYRPSMHRWLVQLGQTLSELGHQEESIRVVQEALDYTRETATFSEAPGERHLLEMSFCLGRLSHLHYIGGNKEAAWLHSEEQIGILRSISPSASAQVSWKHNLSFALVIRGHLLEVDCEDERLATLEEALALLADLHSQNPRNRDLLHDLCIAKRNLGHFYARLGIRDESCNDRAMQLYRDAITGIRQLISQSDSDASLRSDLASFLVDLGLAMRGHPIPDRKACYDEAISTMRVLVAADLKNVTWQVGLANALIRLGYINDDLAQRVGNWSEAHTILKRLHEHGVSSMESENLTLLAETGLRHAKKAAERAGIPFVD